MAKSKKGDEPRVIKAKTKKGKRALEKKAPKLVEDAKKVLVLSGNKVSQLVKDTLLDIYKLTKPNAVKYSRKNDVRPFEVGGDNKLQFFCERSDCSLFCLGHHNKKRPHSVILGRMFNFQLLDMLEVGIKKHVPLQSFSGARHVQSGNKPCFVFVGERFDTQDSFKLAKSLLLDMFRGEVVEEMNLMGLDHVICCYAPGDKTILLRQYAIHMKKSGTRIPRTELEEMGPALDLEVRRCQEAPADLAKEALTQAKLGKKKQKNVDFEPLEGKVGRIYMPAQDLSEVSLAKSKGVKRERRLAAAERKSKKARTPDSDAPDGNDSD